MKFIVFRNYGFLLYGLIIVKNESLRFFVSEGDPHEYIIPLIFSTFICDDFILDNRSFITKHLQTYDDYEQMKQYIKEKLMEDYKKIF